MPDTAFPNFWRESGKIGDYVKDCIPPLGPLQVCILDKETPVASCEILRGDSFCFYICFCVSIMLVFVIASTSVPERLALPASNVAVGSVFNLDFPILYVLYGNKGLILFVFVIVSCKWHLANHTTIHSIHTILIHEILVKTLVIFLYVYFDFHSVNFTSYVYFDFASYCICIALS